MKHYLLIFLLLINLSHVIAQSSFGIGGGILFNKTQSDLENELHTEIEIIEKTPKFTGQLFYEYAFSQKYKEEIRASFKEVSFLQNKKTGDYSGTYDTSTISIRSLDFLTLHKIKLVSKCPLYGEFGVNFSRVFEVDKKLNGHFYNYGPDNIINDSTNNIYSYSYSGKYNPRTWELGFSIGFLYEMKLTEKLILRMEALYFQQLKAVYNLENSFSRAMQFNLGISYPFSALPNKNNKLDTAAKYREKNKSNLFNFGFTYSPFIKTNDYYSYHLSYLRHIQNSKIYVGLGLIRNNFNSGSLDQEYVFHLASEYRPVKFVSLGFNPGFQILNSHRKKIKSTSDFSFSFQYPIEELEIGPFAQFGIRSIKSEFYTGLNVRLKL